jgi:hypothetical protein
MQSDARGNFRFINLPPGVYTLTAISQGFNRLVNSDIILEVGRRLSISMQLEVGDIAQTIEVVSGGAIIDTVSSKAMVNVSAKLIDALPKGRGMIGLMALAPGARFEPAQGGFQLDGASRSENIYNIEGMNTTSIIDGTIGVNPPVDFFQEVVIKSSGFEAEHGGALGGVVNAVVKRGGASWHGSGLFYYRQDALDADPRFFNRRSLTGLVGRLTEPVEQYNPIEDDFTILEPGFEIGGPIAPERVFFYGSYIPRLNSSSRTVNITNVNALGPRTFTREEDTHFAIGRLDGNITDTLHAFGMWNYAYSRTRGISRPFNDDLNGLTNSGAAVDPRTRRPDQGTAIPNTTWRIGGDWTPTPTLVVTGGFGIWSTDAQDRGNPSGVRHFFENASEELTDPNDPNSPLIGIVGLDGTRVASAFQQPANFSDIPSVFTTLFDDFERRSGDIAASYTFHAGGTHTLKGGFAGTQIANDIVEKDNTAFVNIFYNDFFNPSTPQEKALCLPVQQANNTNFGIPLAEGCRGNFGYWQIEDFQTRGSVSSDLYGFYIQDAWNIGYGLTINGGVRFEKEFLPSFNLDTASVPVAARPIEFDYDDKVAPRIGAAWDVMQKGKVKIFGSWGYFFDFMKYDLPRGLFGGEFWHNCAFTLNADDFNLIQPSVSNGFTCNGGTTGATPGIFLGEEDFRIPANSVAAIQAGEVLDPNLEPIRQTEIVVGGEWAMTPDIAWEFRYARKRLRNTIEDVGILGPIAFKPLANDCPTCDQIPPMPKATRDYDSVEIRFNKRFTGNYFLIASYTWSDLSGNYSGLTSTDEDLLQTFGRHDVSARSQTGRASPNVTRFFDEQTMLFDANGQPVFGPLATDRTHTFKAFGGYRFNYWGMDSTVSVNQQIFQGVPLSSRIMYLIDAPFFPWGRGVFADIVRDSVGNWVLNGLTPGRTTPTFTNTDLNISHEFKLSKTSEALRLGIELNILNIFNEANVVSIKDRTGRARLADFMTFDDPTPNCNLLTTDPLFPGFFPSGPCANSGQDFPKFFAGFDPIAEVNAQALRLDTLYGQPLRIQNARTIRIKLRISF